MECFLARWWCNLAFRYKENGYSDWKILHDLNPPHRKDTPREDPTSVASLLFILGQLSTASAGRY
jgi:hypothetical protein